MCCFLFPLPFPCLRSTNRRRLDFPLCTADHLLCPTFIPVLSLPSRMHAFSPQQKHTILPHYQAGVRGAGFDALARRFAVKGGGETIRYWHSKWNGTPHSLEEKKRSGRPRILSSREVQQHVRAPILRANRSHHAVHYTKLLPSVQEETGKNVSVSTLRRYGKDEAGAKHRRGKKRTADESECTHTLKREEE
jgi:transposase